ncbi:16602_t:CDS:2, partial [Acaulospora colombiana]
DMGHSERLTARPRNKRHHTSEASPPSALLRSPVNQHSHGSKRRARQDSPSPGARTPYGSLYPPKGEKRKRTASLNDLHLSTDRNPLWLAIQQHPPPLPLPSPASILPTTSHIETSPSKRLSQHGVRRWHALMELVSTEEGYVRDLKILVRIYLEQLSSVVSLEEDARTEIARNGAELLTLHKKVYRRLQRVITEEQVEKTKPATTLAQRKVEKAIKRVAEIFIKEAASFHLYESFCAGHSQALDLIRQVRGLPEWD